MTRPTIDAREYLFPIYEITCNENEDPPTVDTSTKRFLGTGFFVSPKGDAVTAAHVIPEQLDSNRRLIVVILVNGKEEICWINQAAIILQFDFAILKVNLANTKFFKISEKEVFPGTDVTVLGIPSHQLNNKGLELRVLKGHVTSLYNKLELNFQIPAGMSGAPVFDGKEVIGFATGRIRSEVVEEQREDLITISSTEQRKEIYSISSIIYYGLAQPFFMMSNLRDPVFENRTIMELIADQVASSSS